MKKNLKEVKDLEVKLIPYTMNRDNLRVKNKISPYGVNMIAAPNMWKASYRGKGVKVAIIDSGCDVNHVSLKDNIVAVRNFTTEDMKNPNIVTDRVGHGTHVAGIIAADGKNNSILGVAPEAELYILKAIDQTGSGKLSWVVNAINYAVNLNVDIISMSLGMGVSDDKLERAVNNAVKNGISIVCAAGNEGDGNYDDFEYSYPASYVDVISVGAVDKKSVPAAFSNSNLVIDCVAPGVDIISTYPGNTYASMSGTSMAAPHVTGSLALLKNWSDDVFQRELTPEELYAQLIKFTKTLDYPRTIQGNGIVYLKLR
ncbi:S8 family peptidase [Intestinibacter sp.]|uniref:S8 family peptidase n=1 Tax=Intestinibacter sp. TaxID=1965304 RepID=UPI002A75065B|nr:S8 family peptidase [Intestinibacter sp.]MDY2736197.1 S8 family peptidase [Intestinibacter sp.]MDY4575071.1 S8 family peptidase [Intestinibacter sp.]